MHEHIFPVVINVCSLKYYKQVEKYTVFLYCTQASSSMNYHIPQIYLTNIVYNISLVWKTRKIRSLFLTKSKRIFVSLGIEGEQQSFVR